MGTRSQGCPLPMWEWGRQGRDHQPGARNRNATVSGGPHLRTCSGSPRPHVASPGRLISTPGHRALQTNSFQFSLTVTTFFLTDTATTSSSPELRTESQQSAQAKREEQRRHSHKCVCGGQPRVWPARQLPEPQPKPLWGSKHTGVFMWIS